MAWPRMKATLPAMKKGTMFLRSPAWLDAVRRIAVRPKRTFDSSSTPGARPGAGAPLRPSEPPPTVGGMPVPSGPSGPTPPTGVPDPDATAEGVEAIDAFDLDDRDDDLDDNDLDDEVPDAFPLHDDDPSSGDAP